MINPTHNHLRMMRWQALRKHLRKADEAERSPLLLEFIEEIRALTPLAIKSSQRQWDKDVCIGAATLFGVVFGAWAALEPINLEWPGRDRFFLARDGDLITICSTLALLGLFIPEDVGPLADHALAEPETVVVPGLEQPFAPSETVIRLAWESALESGRSKRYWREYFAGDGQCGWATTEWRNSPAVWRTSLFIDANSAGSEQLCDLLMAADEKPAGLAIFISAPRNEAGTITKTWQDKGWQAQLIGRNDAPGFYQTLTSQVADKPLAIICESMQPSAAKVKPQGDIAESNTLLCELSDEQFNAAFDESLNF